MFTCEFRKRRNRTGLYWTPCTINRIEDKTVKAKKKKKKKKRNISKSKIELSPSSLATANRKQTGVESNRKQRGSES